MADKNFKGYSVVPLRSYGSKKQLEGFEDESFLDSPIPSIGVYASKSYLKDYNKKLKEDQAPQNIPIETVKALAKSEALARKNNLLPKEVIDYYLPGALVEGRYGDFGVNEVLVNNKTKPSKRWEEINILRNDLVNQAYKQKKISKEELDTFNKFGYLSNEKAIPDFKLINKLFYSEDLWPSTNVSDKVQTVRDASYKLGFQDYSTDIRKNNLGYTKVDIYEPHRSSLVDEALALNPKALESNANLKTIALINKSIEKENKTPLDYWTAYNGRGIAKDDKGRVIASPEIYKRKLLDTQEVINHPANTEFKRLYSDLVQGYMTGRIK
jgi:hypothetical protein